MNNKAKVVAIFGVIVSVFILLASTVSAESEDIYTYLLSDGGVVITGVVDRTNFSGVQIIPEEIGGVPVTEIDTYALLNCKNLTNITISEGVKRIGNFAFSYCEKLYNITLPYSIKEIGSSAFAQCRSLKNVIIPNGVTSIGSSAFEECENIEDITLPASVTRIEQWTFKDCTKLTSVTIPRSINYIHDAAFDGCENLKIVGYANSYAETYATENSITFIEIVPISYSFGQSVQIGLIEPWFLKANARVYTTENPTNIDYSALVDYGAYFIRASALEDKNATQESLTVEDIINNSATSKYSKSEGTATVDGSYITANYDKGLYTYELDDSVFVLFYIEDANGITYAPIRERNLKALLEARCNDTTNFPNELEREVYKKMLDIFEAISEYREDYFSKN